MYDVVIIGGGPAGMMAAGGAAQRGRSVLLLEKNPGLGKKLLITGGGRCNVTNLSTKLEAYGKADVRSMLSRYKESDQFLFSAFAQFGVKDALDFFNSRGMPTKEENEGRIFPVSNSAKSVWDVLVKYMKEGGVKIQTGVTVTGISVDSVTKKLVITMKSDPYPNCNSVGKAKTIIAQSCILATGGKSRPETGSTGECFGWLKKLGHTIIENNFALVPITLSDSWAKKLGGVTLKDIKIKTVQNGVKQASAIGKILFTHFGVSGPTILNMSKEIGELLQYGAVTIELDLFPKNDIGTLRRKLQELLVAESNKKLKNVLSMLVPSALVSPILELAHCDGETATHSVSSDSRKNIAIIMKAITLNVTGLLGADKAVVSSGGVALEDVNFKTMESRRVSGLYLVGDVLNIDRPSGGYSLQLCWTTGAVAGTHC